MNHYPQRIAADFLRMSWPPLVTVLLSGLLEIFSRRYFRIYNPGVIISLLVSYLAFVTVPGTALTCAFLGSLYSLYNLSAFGESVFDLSTMTRGILWFINFPLLVVMIQILKNSVRSEKKQLHDDFQTLMKTESIRSQKITDALIESVPSIMWSATSDGDCDFFNHNWYSYTGLTRAESLGKGWQRCLEPDDGMDFLEHWQRSIDSGHPFERSFRLKRHDGEYRWHVARVVPVRGESGEIARWFGSCMDIHEKKADLDASHFSHKVLESTTHAIIGVNRGGLIYSWNPGAVKLFDYTPDEAMGRPIADIVRACPHEKDAQIQAIRSAIQGEQIVGREVVRLRKDGKPLTLTLSVSPFNPDSEGRQNGVVIYQDMTELRSAEVLAHNRLKEIAAVFEAMSDGVVAFAMNGELSFSNENFRRIMGMGVDDALNDTQAFFGSYETHTKDGGFLPLDQWPIARALRGESIKSELLQCRRGGVGAWKWLTFSAEPVRNERQQQILAMVVVRDVSSEIEARQAAETADVAAKSAISATNLKSKFVASVSHELRTPLNGILGMSDLLFDTPLTAQQRYYVETLKRSGESLLLIVNDILDLSKIEADKLIFETIAFDLKKLIDSVISPFASAAQDKNIELISSFDLSEQNIFLGDPSRIRQVLFNLLSNAIKFTDKGRVTLTVRARRLSGARFQLDLEVCDSGMGMSKETVAKIFQPFTQAEDSTSRRFGGTGLGLVISRKLAELMNGSLTVESEKGQGSRFHLLLDLDAADASFLVAIADPVAVKSQMDGRQLSILLADDNAINQVIARSHLEKLGHRVVTVANGREVVEAMTSGHFDLIFMDCHMPELDGYDATREIRRSEQGRPAIPIIAITANAMEGEKARCLAAGMNDHISKPISREKMRLMLEKWVA